MILEKIKDIMEEELGKDRNEVTLESDIIKDLGLDSLISSRLSWRLRTSTDSPRTTTKS